LRPFIDPACAYRSTRQLPGAAGTVATPRPSSSGPCSSFQVESTHGSKPPITSRRPSVVSIRADVRASHCACSSAVSGSSTTIRTGMASSP
jgi:hypothetical protein